MRDDRFSILKGIAILCVVLCHAGVPAWMNNFLFLFHMPVFFICAGYFFSTRYLADERTFVVHRVRKLYLPFLRWSVVLLLLHNVWFSLGILSERYGNASNGVLHPYTWHQFCQHLWSIVFNMSGYDQFLGGSFWFFRALFVSSILFLLLFKVMTKSEHLRGERQSAWAVLVISLFLVLWKQAGGLQLTGLGQGGYRELLGISFMAVGFLARQYKLAERMSWRLSVPALIVVILAAVFCPTSMEFNPSVGKFLSLPLPAVAGFVGLLHLSMLIHGAAGRIARLIRPISRALTYIGERTIYIFAFHLLAFKVVSALKVAIYGLPWEAVGGHPYVLEPTNNAGFVLLYVLAGVGLPLLWMEGYRRVAANVNFTERLTISFIVLAAKQIAQYGWKACRFILQLCLNFWQAVKHTIKEIIAVSSTKDE